MNRLILFLMVFTLASMGQLGCKEDSSSDTEGTDSDEKTSDDKVAGDECVDGETFEWAGVTYECVDGYWPKDDEKSDTCNLEDSAGVQSLETLEHDGETREYLVYTPKSYDGESAVPLMLNFHGFGGTVEGYMCDADMRSLADSENFILVYPQGTLLDGSSHWNFAEPSEDNKSNADDLGFVTKMLAKLFQDNNIDEDRVYACGYSNGAFMSYALACKLSDKIAAVGGVSGTMQDIASCNPSHPTPIIAINGTSDGVVPYDGGNGFSSVEDTLNFWIDYNNTKTTPTIESVDVSNTTVEHYSYVDGDGNTPVEHYKIIDGDHVWFDIDYNGSNTSKLIWDFVSKWDINGIR